MWAYETIPGGSCARISGDSIEIKTGRETEKAKKTGRLPEKPRVCTWYTTIHFGLKPA